MASVEERRRKAEAIKKELRKDLEANPYARHADLAQKYDVAASTISQYARDLGFQPNRAEKIVKNFDLMQAIAKKLEADPSLSYNAVAKEHGVRANRVSHFMRTRHGTVRKKTSTSHDWARWAQMFERGLSIARIAQITGFNQDTISVGLQKRGISARAYKSNLAEQALALMQAEGIGISEAAMRVGTKVAQIYSHRARKRNKEKQDADEQRLLLGYDGHHQPGYHDTKAGRGGHASGAPVGGSNDLRAEKGRQDHRGLGDADAPEGQAHRQRLRRCG